ncbi:MAG: FtsX-like permease family protein [Candidatus Levybacteria bacterium]|nr:FtsX-like permease family protein [Candidatus Levybacteria bacterium]
MFIALFTISGILTFLLTKRPALAIFSIIFLFGLRLRLNELIHMAPYYLFASWLLASALTLNIYNIIEGKRRLISAGFVVVLGCLVSLFIAKNWYEFSQIAFNRFPQKNARTVEFVGQHANKDERLLVISGFSASYYYDANLFQYGYFVNYFEWYDRSLRLKRIWLKDISDYNGRFLIVPRAEWITYCQDPTSYPGWLKMTFELVQKNYLYSGYENQDDIVWVPLTIAQKQLFGSDYLTSIALEAKSPEVMVDAQNEVGYLLLAKHKLNDPTQADFSIFNQQDILNTVNQSTATFTSLLAGIAAISLLVGGIGIMNIMLVTVTERTREIGLRKALGAKKKIIITQFLIESIIITFAGGIIGIGAGILASFVITNFTNSPFVVSPSSILLAFAVSAGIGILFGWYPASRAANLQPIEALRYE